VISNFRDRRECRESGIVTAFVDDDDHACGIVRQGEAWSFMSAERLLTKEEQEYCAQMNFKMENGDE